MSEFHFGVHTGPQGRGCRSFSVGDRVETVGLTDEDSDTGRVIAIDGDIATVAWASGVRTACAIESLRTVEVAS